MAMTKECSIDNQKFLAMLMSFAVREMSAHLKSDDEQVIFVV
jgi:hypothetical protein